MYYISTYLSNLSYCSLRIIFKFTDFLVLSIDFFYSILVIIFLCLEKKRCNSSSFYISLKTGFLKGKAYFSYLIFIIMRMLKFFEYILVSITITSCRHNKNKITKRSAVKLEVRLKIGVEAESELGSKIESKVGSKVESKIELKVGLEIGSEFRLEVGSKVGLEFGLKIRAEIRSEVRSKVRLEFRSNFEVKVFMVKAHI